MSIAQNLPGETFETTIPARLDRLPWSRFHTLLVLALGITWILDGLEVTLMGAIGAVLTRPDVMHFSAAQIGFISSCYLAGAVIGSLVFGHLTDRFGRRKFFFLSLSIYLAGVGLTAFSWNLASFAVFRFITGAGIGGEYSAVNSAIDELIPARLRGRIDLMINGSFWLGAAVGLVINHRHPESAGRALSDWMAAGLRHRRFGWLRDFDLAQARSGESALAAGAWARAGCRADRR